MTPLPGDERERLLDPVDRISEVLFGLIMAVTIVGSLSIATAGQGEVRAVTLAALGCNVAWGLVDAVMYLVRIATERARNRALAHRIVGADTATAHRLIRGALPDPVIAMTGDAEVEGMRRKLLAAGVPGGPLLRRRDFAEALGVFLVVIIATFPVVVPFLLTDDAPLAFKASRAITLVMLFVAGIALGRYAGYAKPLRSGLAMAAFGAVLILAVMALGG